MRMDAEHTTEPATESAADQQATQPGDEGAVRGAEASKTRRNPLTRRLPVALLVLGLGLGFAGGAAIATSSDDVQVKPAAADTSQLTKALTAANTANAANTVDDRGFSKLENGVQHSHGFEQPVSPEDRVLLAHQMDLARETAMRYPTLADAEAAGLRRAGPFSPGLGTHMISYGNFRYSAGDGVMTDDQITHPLAWIYDGTKPESRVAGLFYQSFSKTPQGFAGPNDVWHQHTNICFKVSPDGGTDTPLGADHDATKEQCDAVGGRLITATGPLLHVWAVPGYEDVQGVYAHLNPAVTCADGTYDVIPDVTKVGTRTSICKDGAE
jgi:hypothetical protein